MKTFLKDHKMSFLLPSLSFFFLFSCLLNTFVSPTQHLCHSDQSEALLEFKSEFVIKNPTWFRVDISSHPKTKSWKNNSDCCFWDGITCDANSGKVIGLNLSASCLHGRLESNSSLFRLRHLRDLNLAYNKLVGYNNFFGSPIPAEFNQLKELERLNLSKSSFSGKIPTKLLQLTKLVSLDLSHYPYTLIPLSIDESFLPLLIRNLRNLRVLDMSSVYISSEIPHELSSMWSLRAIRLASCNLLGEFPNNVFLIPNLQSIILHSNPDLRGSLPVFRGNNSVKILSLSYTSFSGNIPDSINNLKHLTSLELGSSFFSGRIPSSLGNLSYLSSLILFDNDFFGEIPSSIENLKHLRYFSVSGNKFSGVFPSALLNLTQLRFIDLGSNQFTGLLPPNISHLPLEIFDVDENSLTGVIPSSLFMIPSLKSISLGNNQFNGFAGIENISHLLDLQELSLGYNKFMGNPVDLNIFSPLKKLEYLSLSGLPLTASNISYDLAFSSRLLSLELSDCNLTEFPEFIKNQRNLSSIDLSNNKIKGQVPYWLWRLPELRLVNLSDNSFSGFKGSLMALPDSEISYLDLSSNAFQGTLLIPPRFIRYFYASKNNFTGEIPRSICKLASPSTLDVSDNNLNGSIPWCLKNQMSSLEDLYLQNNNFTGSLPDIFINAKALMLLDVSYNRLEGNLPPSLTACSILEVLNVGSNKINGMFPFTLNSLKKLKVLVLRSNKFHGTLHNDDGGWFGFPQLKIIDVSHNDFHGSIPWCLKNHMSSLEDLNLQINNFGGSLPDIFINAKSLLSLDVSHNQLEGNLPPSLTACSSLEILNVGRNKINDMFPFKLNSLKKLKVLVLSSNKFHGTLHNGDGGWFGFPLLNIIDVSHNDFVGTLPNDYFVNWTAISSTRDNSTKLDYLSGGNGYYTLDLDIKGVSLKMERILVTYTTIDFSGNQLQGKIPDSIGLLKGLLILNLSRNAFTDHIPSSLANLTMLESLDISQNNISGEIPPELGTLYSLGWINVSHNQLVGPVPQGTQFQRQNCSSYEGNPGLFGPSLKDVCGDNKTKSHQFEEPMSSEEEEEEEESFSWKAAGLTLIPGVVFGLAMGYKFMKTFGRNKK